MYIRLLLSRTSRQLTMDVSDPVLPAVPILGSAVSLAVRILEVCETRKRRAGNKRLHRRSLIFISLNLDDHEFKRAFRMTRASFENLCRKLGPLLQRDELQGARSSSGAISVNTQITIFVRM